MRTLRHVLVALLLAAACHPPARPPAPVHHEAAPDELYTVLSRTVHYTFAADGSYTRVVREHQRWNDTPPGERTIEAERGRWDHAPAELAAILTRPDGARFKLDPTTIQNYVYKVQAPLPDLRAGTEVVETITRRSAGAPVWSEVLDEPLRSYIPLRRLTVVIESPIALTIHHTIEGTAVTAREQVVGATRRLTWTADDIPASDDEFDVPHDLFVEPRLVFRAQDHDWRAVARAYGDLVDAALADFTVPPEARAIIAADTPRAHKIAALTAWRRRHADELSPKIDDTTPPLSAAAVRTDEATVLVGLLRAAGIPAHVALYRDELFKADVSPRFPGLRQFTTTLVVVPGQNPLWIEPVGDHTPPGLISENDLGRLALIAAPETTSLVRLPFPRPEDNTYRETHTITLPAYGRARDRTELTTTGYTERWARSDWYGDPTRWSLTRRVAQHALHNIEISPPHELDVPLRVVADVDTTDDTRTDLDSARVALHWHKIIDLPGPWAPPRRNPHTMTPYDNSLTYRITLPPDFTAQIPTFNPQGLAPLQVERTVTQDGDTLVVTLRARLDVDRVSVEQYDRLHREFPRLEAEHGHILAIHDARLARERRDLRAAHTLLARNAADPHAGTIERLRLADLLGRVHLHARALAEVRAVLAAEPDHALAHAMLADLLRTDRLGRVRRSGWDRAGAMAASLRAAELDKSRLDARLDAADDAEAGDDGALYGPGSDLTRAAELRAAIRTYELERLADPAPIVRELELLWHLGRLDELADRLKYMDAPPRIGRRMLAWRQHGVPGLLADLDADRNISSAGRAIDIRAMYDLLLERESYADLTPLIDALPKSEVQADTDLRLRHRAALQAAPRAAAATPPQQIVLRLLDAAITDPAALPALLSTRVDDPARTLANVAQLWPVEDRTALSLARVRHLRDVAVGSLTFTADGDDSVGHRIQTAAHTFYVVREGPDFRLRATSSHLPELLHEAAARLAAGDVAGGRQWLAWYYAGTWRTGGHVLGQAPDVLLRFEDRAEPAVIVQAGLAMLGEPDALTKILAARAALADDDPIAIHLDHAIVRAGGRPADAARALARLRVRFAGSDALAMLEIHHASRTHAWQRRDRLTERLLADHPDNDSVRRAWALELARRGRPARAIDVLRALHDEHVTAVDLNNMAWWSLFVGDGVPDARALTSATRAAADGQPARLHTLACVYAAMGRTGDALVTFDELLRARGEPAPEDLFILAEIHRALGYTAEARAAYTELASQDPGSTTSTAALARRRLARR